MKERRRPAPMLGAQPHREAMTEAGIITGGRAYSYTILQSPFKARGRGSQDGEASIVWQCLGSAV